MQGMQLTYSGCEPTHRIDHETKEVVFTVFESGQGAREIKYEDLPPSLKKLLDNINFWHDDIIRQMT